jgi:hypothetical protein
MNISAVSANAQVQAMAGPEDKRAGLQLMLLKKTLDMQQQEAAAIMQEFEGKGQNIDMRV